jgi:hypothetical protein
LADGFRTAKLFHPLHDFGKVRYEATVASPDAGRVEIDSLSDARDESRRSSDDLISMRARTSRFKPDHPDQTTTSGVTMTGSSTQPIKTVPHPVSDLATAREVRRNG